MDGRQAAESFHQSFASVFGRFRRRVRPSGYVPSPESLAVLEHLFRTGPLTTTEAARHFSRSQAAMSEIVQRLEARGLVARVADTRDRRRTLIWLSDSGRRVLGDARNVLSIRLLEHAFDQLPESVRRELNESLARLLETMPAEEGWDDD
ncbi:MAG: MarR family transcriptional regulator [Planctomycetes bacterium]|nr:MarR family transcriptional regulator [Planctomycetota bacterium]